MATRPIAARDVVRGGAPPTGAGTAPDEVAVEEPLEIRIAGEPVAVTMRTPGQDARLAVGFLFAEGVVSSCEDVGTLRHCGRAGEEGYGNAIDVIPASGAILDAEAIGGARRGTLTTSACGVCGRRTIADLLERCAPVSSELTIRAAVLACVPELLRSCQPTFAQTGGTHAAALLGSSGELLAAHEDVGRHNAVDKVVGALVLEGVLSRPPRAVPGRPAALIVSGRASFEIVQKAAMASVPIVASVSAASSLAIDLADRAGVTLCAFVRGGGYNLYTHPWRISP